MNWTKLIQGDERAQRLFARFGADACSTELVCDGELCGHITASARIWNFERTRFVRVWSAKNQQWQLPGAHGEGDFDLEAVARRQARRALGLSLDATIYGGSAVELGIGEIAVYWNTPAHLHFSVVFEFEADEKCDLPRGARWFGSSS